MTDNTVYTVVSSNDRPGTANSDGFFEKNAVLPNTPGASMDNTTYSVTDTVNGSGSGNGTGSFYEKNSTIETLVFSDDIVQEMVAQVAIATAEAGVATTEAGIATTEAGIATTQAGIATTEAGIATTQAGIATTQAGIATTEAGIATTQASNASTSATNAAASEASAASHDTSAGTHDTNAAASATAAATSASNAASSASSAASHDSSAATHDSNAATSASNAHTSEVNAAASAASAASSTTAAVAAAQGTATPIVDGTAAVGTSTKWAHEDHVHPTDTSRAPLASPTFTGTPAAPTPTAGDNTTKLATTAFVAAALAAFSAGSTVYVQDTAPVGATAGSLWWRSTDGSMFVNYNDGTSTQWVAASIQATLPGAVQYDVAQSLSSSQKGQAGQNLGLTFGQCQLVKSGSNLVLLPKNGNLLTVNGVPCSIPSAGVSLAPTGLTVSTLYYIYAVATAGVVTSIEASTTGHTLASNGIETKTGDTTRTLVGMAVPQTGPAWTDTETGRYVRSWFNRTRLALRGNSATNTALNAGIQELSTALRCGFVCWSDDAITSETNGLYFSSFSALITFAMNYDGSTTRATSVINTDSSGRVLPNPCFDNTTLSEGAHYVTLFGSATTTASMYSATFITGSVG